MIEYFQSNMWQLWLLVCLLCLILELTSGDFFIMCFSLGALAALVATPFTGFVGQLVVWMLGTVLCLLFVRPVMLKYFHKKDSDRPSNADALMGRTGTVSQTIVAGDHGRVKIAGDDWKAVSAATTDIPVGAKVKVVGRDSIILTVTPVNQ